MPSSPAIKARRRLLVMPVTANSRLARAPARAWTRGSPNRKAGALLPSSVTVDCAIRSKAGLARTVPWPTRLSVQQSLVDRTGLGLQVVEVGQQALAADVVGVVDHGLDAQRTAVLEVLLGPRVLVDHVDGHALGVPVDGGLEGAGGLSSARVAFEDDLDTFGAAEVEVSATRASKKDRAWRGASSTMVREVSTWRMVRSHQNPPSRSAAESGSREVHRSKNTRIVPGPSRSQIACRAAGSSQEANPLDSSVKPIPALVACRLAHSWPLTHTLIG